VAVIRRPVNLVVTTVDESMSWLLRQLGRARPCAARALTRQREVVFHRRREWDSIRSRGHRMDTSTSAQVTIAVLLDGTLVCAHGVSRVNKASPEFSLRSHSIPAPRLDVVAQESVTVSTCCSSSRGVDTTPALESSTARRVVASRENARLSSTVPGASECGEQGAQRSG